MTQLLDTSVLAGAVQTRSRPYSVAVAIACAVAGFSSASRAAEWRFEPRLEVAAVVDDNYLLDPVGADEVDVAGGAVDASAVIGVAHPRSFFEIEPAIHSTFFPGDSDVEATDEYLRLGTGYHTERLDLGLDGRYSSVVLVKGSLSGTALGSDLGEGTAGQDAPRLNQSVREDTLRLKPTFTFDMSPVWQLIGAVQYLDVSHDKSGANEYVDYDNEWAMLGIGYRTSPTSTLSVRVTGSWYNPDPVTVDEATSYALQAEWVHRVSKVSRWYVRAGGSSTTAKDQQTGQETFSNETAFSGGAGVRWDWQVTSLFLDAATGIVPKWSGGVADRDEVRMNLVRQFSPKLSGLIGARWLHEGAVSNNVNDKSEEYGAGSLGVEWRMTRAWALTAEYEYTTRDYGNTGGNAKSNAFNVAIVYEPYRPEDRIRMERKY